MHPDKLRPGDVVLIKATVTERGDLCRVDFGSPDRGPVDVPYSAISEIKSYKIAKGYRVKQNGGTEELEVIHVFDDLDPPQLAYRVVGNWPVQIGLASNFRRL